MRIATRRLHSIIATNRDAANAVEDSLAVTIQSDESALVISGDPQPVKLAAELLKTIDDVFTDTDGLDAHALGYLSGLNHPVSVTEFASTLSQPIYVTPKGYSVRLKTIGQKIYMDAILNNEVVLCVGPAGSGKTYLGVAAAVMAFQKKEVSRIILTRPAVEAGERLGFLPGDLQEKVDPYMRPIYDALKDLLGFEAFQRYYEKGLIEVSPLAFMRGRTLDDSFILLDEAQNTTIDQMIMFLTRIGMNSKACVCGDITQIDLPPGIRNGLSDAVNVLSGIDGIKSVFLSSSDIVRNPIVQKIVRAYQKDHSEKRRDQS
ncbi:MAG: PhoH family protein [Clostridiaceae bacterium]|nr:PhoH family protein [Clostridiaceae bacterium]